VLTCGPRFSISFQGSPVAAGLFSFLLLLLHQLSVLLVAHYVAGLYWRRILLLFALLIHLISFYDVAQIR
jgi:hypothetical protein